MPNPIAPRLNGDDYQARHFWFHALEMLDPLSGVASVGYEWKEAKSFDDVTVVFDPPRGQAHRRPLARHFRQVKWQASRAIRFGYADLADPAFIGAASISLLERLRDAYRPSDPVTRFSLVTTARIADGDPLADLVSTEDGVLRLDKLRDGKTSRSRMGFVRECWRECMSLANDEELFAILETFAILDGQPDMEAMQDAVTTKARSVGIQIPLTKTSASDFRFDSLARQLIKRNITSFNRAELVQFLADEGIQIAPTLGTGSPAVQIAVLSFERLARDLSRVSTENMLSLLDMFEGRYLKTETTWKEATDKVAGFLTDRAGSLGNVRLILDAHASLAFAAGRVLHLKSGVRLELVQNGRKGSEIWHATDGSHINAPCFQTSIEHLGEGSRLALAVGVARSTTNAVKRYLKSASLPVSNLLVCELPAGPDQSGVRGGEHAAVLSDQIAALVRNMCSTGEIKAVDLFVAAPNAFSFYLGQQAQAIGPHQMYEFDFDGSRGSSYTPSV